MPNTDNYQLPYPAATDAPNGFAQIENLAEAVDLTVKTVDNKVAALQAIKPVGNPGGTSPNIQAESHVTANTNASGGFLCPFPIAFDGPPVVVACSGNYGVCAFIAVIHGTETASTWQGVAYLANGQPAANVGIRVNYIAYAP